MIRLDYSKPRRFFPIRRGLNACSGLQGGGLVIRSVSKSCESKGEGVAWRSTDCDYNQLRFLVNANRPGIVAVTSWQYRSSFDNGAPSYAIVKISQGAVILTPSTILAHRFILRRAPGFPPFIGYPILSHGIVFSTLPERGAGNDGRQFANSCPMTQDGNSARPLRPAVSGRMTHAAR